MAGFVLRKNQRLKELVPVRYRGEGVAGEGMLTDLSLSGGSIRGNVPLSVGMVLGLQMFIPGDPEPLLIDHAIVKWVKGKDFGVELTPPRQVAARMTQIITKKVKKQHGSPSRDN